MFNLHDYVAEGVSRSGHVHRPLFTSLEIRPFFSGSTIITNYNGFSLYG